MNAIGIILIIGLYIFIFYIGYFLLRKAIEEGIYRAGKRLYQELDITIFNKQQGGNKDEF